MSRRAPHVCSVPGCPNLVPPGRAHYCPAHERERQRGVNARRPADYKEPYGAEWQRVRAAYLAEHPACARCGAPATDVHHVVPLRAGGTHDEANLQSLCRPCHSAHTARHDGGFGNAGRRWEGD